MGQEPAEQLQPYFTIFAVISELFFQQRGHIYLGFVPSHEKTKDSFITLEYYSFHDFLSAAAILPSF